MKFAAKGNEFLHDLEVNLRTEDRAHAARILKSTFRVLRNHLTIAESLQFLAQLPMALKAVYVDGWASREHHKIHSLDDFLVEFVQEDGDAAWRDFGSREDIIDSIRATLHTLRTYVSHEEMEQALGTLPAEIHNAFAEPELETD